MSVQLDPPELGFRRPFTDEVTQLLRLSNPSSDPIEPSSEVEVQVLLQMHGAATKLAKC
jgi:hypothetical protein